MRESQGATTSDGEGAGRQVLIPPDPCRGPAVLGDDAGVTGLSLTLAVELVPTLPGLADVVSAGRATSVPFTAVLTGPERTTTDNTTVAGSCAVRWIPR